MKLYPDYPGFVCNNQMFFAMLQMCQGHRNNECCSRGSNHRPSSCGHFAVIAFNHSLVQFEESQKTTGTTPIIHLISHSSRERAECSNHLHSKKYYLVKLL